MQFMNTTDELAIPLDDIECNELDGFLLALDTEQAVQNLSEFDGFLTAIVSGPEFVAPSEWLPVVLGGREYASGPESSGDFNRMVDLMMRHLNSTAVTLLENPGSFEPCFMENVGKGGAFLVVDDWCIGYMKGVMMREEQWFGAEGAMADTLSPIPLFASSEGWDLLEQLADRHIEYLQKQVAPAARAAHGYWLQRGEKWVTPRGRSVH
jgi:uncharacterized protein